MKKEFNEKDSDLYDLEYFLGLEYRYFSGAIRVRLKTILKYLNKLELKGKRVLDVGCGGGELTNIMKELGAEVMGCDYSQYAVEFAKERYPQLNVIRCSAYEIDELGLKDLNLITAFDIVEHMKESEIFFERAFNLLKTKGYLLIVTDNKDYLFSKEPFSRLRNLLLRTSSSGRAYRLIKKVEARRRRFKDVHKGHINIMNIKTLAEKIEQAGFQIEKIVAFSSTSVPILDFFSKFLPSSKRGDHQLIIAAKI